MYKGLVCENRVFVRGKTYDIYMANPTADFHPMHVHLVTSQMIGRIPLDSDRFMVDYYNLNVFKNTQGLDHCGQFPKI